jgi:hypothetical protein
VRWPSGAREDRARGVERAAAAWESVRRPDATAGRAAGDHDRSAVGDPAFDRFVHRQWRITSAQRRHDDSPALGSQRIQQAAIGTRVGVYDIDWRRRLIWGQCIPFTWKCPTKQHAALIEYAERAQARAVEGVEHIRVDLGHVTRGVDAAVEYDEDA